MVWRENKDLPPGRLRLASPYDIDARYGVKRGYGWTGCKVHLTETCDDAEQSGTPHVITNVETTDATVTDQEMTPLVHEHLAHRGPLPGEHAVDAGYMSAELILGSLAEHGVELVGPVGADTTWQAGDPDAVDLRHFIIDWDAEQVRCPNGALSSTWRHEKDRDKQMLEVDFRKASCVPASRAPSTRPPLRASAGPATSACPKPTWRTCSPPPRSTSSVGMPGGPDILCEEHEPLISVLWASAWLRDQNWATES